MTGELEAAVAAARAAAGSAPAENDLPADPRHRVNVLTAFRVLGPCPAAAIANAHAHALDGWRPGPMVRR